MTATTQRRAVGVARQSSGDGESVAQQITRLEDACQRDGLELLEVHPEQDVSGRTPLAKRKGLSAALAAIEAGDADVLVVAYFDRLARSLKVQAEVVERVEAKGGRVLALDTGEVTNGSAGQWLSSTLLGAISEYHCKITAEKTRAAHAALVRAGAWPSPQVPPGYLRGADGVLEVDELGAAPAMKKAFAMRRAGASVADVHRYLAANGIKRSVATVGNLLASRVYRGELRFGSHEPNLTAHPELVDEPTFAACQELTLARGPRAKSERLLARLGILVCDGCGGRMTVGMTRSNGKAWPNYRCPAHGPCAGRASIAATLIEDHVSAITRAEFANATGEASALTDAVNAQNRAEHVNTALQELIASYTRAGVMAEPASEAAVAAKREERDAAIATAKRASRLAGIRRILLEKSWDRLTVDERRELIAAALIEVRVSRGYGLDRVEPVLARQQ